MEHLFRFAPHLELPTRPFVPGHPDECLRQRPPAAAELPVETALRFGADLWNAGFLWEAHEAWEHPWHVWRTAADPRALALRAMIQAAAVGLKLRIEDVAAANSVALKAANNFSAWTAAGSPGLDPLDVQLFAADFANWSLDRADDWLARPQLAPTA